MIPVEWLQNAPEPRPLANGEKWNVFLSYRSVNRTWVLLLYDILSELKFKVFIDQLELIEGETLIYRLEEGLRRSQAGILVWSVQAADSPWVRQEYERMVTKSIENPRFNFVPIKINQAELPEFADNKIFIDFSSYPDGPNGGELIRLVYGIVGQHMSADTVRFANEQNEAARSAMKEIDTAVRNGYAEDILALANSNTLPWKTTPSLGCKAGESLIKLKLYTDAITVLEKVRIQFPRSVRPRQLYALALARRAEGDDLKNAQRILGKLYEEGERDPETLGIYARTWMDRYDLSKDPKDLRNSRNYYAEAFARTDDDYYTGINAAAKSLLLDDPALADIYAARVSKIVGDDPAAGDYWKTATIAEALLIRQKYGAAAVMYQHAIDMEPNSTGNHETSWKQAERLMKKLEATEAEKVAVSNVFAPYITL
jgi:hypothetical protein